MNERLQEALSLYRDGDKAQAAKLLAGIVQQEPNNSVAWYGSALCLDDPDKKNYCLKRVLSLDASHKKAQQLLEKLQAVQQQQPESQNSASYPRQTAVQKTVSLDWTLMSVVGLLAALMFCVVMRASLTSRINVSQL